MEQFEDYRDFLRYIENNFCEEEQLIIEDFISYYSNKYKGFSHHNCEYNFQANVKYDISGNLHKLALIGFHFEKKNYDKRQLKKITIKDN
jgi:hypothetical protein